MTRSFGANGVQPDERWAKMASELSGMDARLKAETANLAPIPGEDVVQPVQADIAPPTDNPLDPTPSQPTGLPNAPTPSDEYSGLPEISTTRDGVLVIKTPQGDQYCPIDPEGYGGGDCDTNEILRDSSRALRILGELLQLSGTMTNVAGQLQFQNAIKDAYNNIRQQQDRMMQATEGLASVSGDIASNNQRIGELYSSLADIQRNMANELTNIATLTASVSSLDTRLSSQSNDLLSAQARFDRALVRSNYGPGVAGLSQQRADLRSANMDIFNINSTIADLQNTKANYIADMNASGDRYNGYIPMANDARSSLGYSYDLNSRYEADRNAYATQYNVAGEAMRGQFNRAISASEDYQKIQATARNLTDLATGSRGVASALNNIAEGNNYSAGADFLNAGIGPLIRNFAPALTQYTGTIGGLVSDAGRSIDQTIRSGGSFEQGMENFMLDAGQRLVGAKDGIRMARSLELVSNYLDKGDIDGAGMVMESVTIPSAMSMLSTSAQTGLTISGVGAPVSGLVRALTPATTSAVVGTVSTIRNMTLAPITQELTPSQPRGFGRGLVKYSTPSGQATGAPSSLTIGLVGAYQTLETTAVDAVKGVMGQNPQSAQFLSMRISDMATQGGTVNWPRNPQPGDYKLVPPVGGVAGD